MSRPVVRAGGGWWGRSVYDIHVPLSVDDLARAHRDAGLEVLAAEWLVPMNMGVLNVSGAAAARLRQALMGVSFGVWLLDRALGNRLPRSQAFSAYVGCIARRPG